MIKEEYAPISQAGLHTKPSNGRIGFGPGCLQPAHDIDNAQWKEGTFLFNSTGTDPILLLGEYPFDPSKEYIFRISGEAQDRRWSIYYKTSMEQEHSSKRCIGFNLHNSSGMTEVALPTGLCPQKLRLDPGTRKGTAAIYNIEIVPGEAAAPTSNTCSESAQNELPGIIHTRCKGMKTNDWAQMLDVSVKNPRIGDMRFPGFPEERVQMGTVGASGTRALHEAALFYEALEEETKNLSWVLDPSMRVLDFGCGWGRLTRFFLKDLYYGNLFGADTVSRFIKILHDIFPGECQSNNDTRFLIHLFT